MKKILKDKYSIEHHCTSIEGRNDQLIILPGRIIKSNVLQFQLCLPINDRTPTRQ